MKGHNGDGGPIETYQGHKAHKDSANPVIKCKLIEKYMNI